MLKRRLLPILGAWAVIRFLLDNWARLQELRDFFNGRGAIVKWIGIILTSQWLPIGLFAAAVAVLAVIHFDLFPSKKKKTDDDDYRRELVSKLTQLVSASYKHTIATFDSQTKESIIIVAKLIDDFLVRLADAPPDQRSFDMFRDDYRKIEVELRQLKLRTAARPLNSISTAQVEIIFRMWGRFKELHQKKGNISPVFVQEYNKLVTKGLSEILELEEHKPKD
jgi:hypothetical protein